MRQKMESRDLANGAGYIEWNTTTGFVYLNKSCVGRIGSDTAGGGWLTVKEEIHGAQVKMTADFLFSQEVAFDLLGELVMSLNRFNKRPGR